VLVDLRPCASGAASSRVQSRVMVLFMAITQ
jgi:hypothetical protein